ncbi:MAG TPA: PadR family transcriptional regulator [Eubacteriaceae bacterium]|nr:PadR family transcriptional regulator [Eubacteriaceae bacterium]
MARIGSIDMGELTDTIYYILIALLEESHGYRIMQKVEQITGGEFVIGPGSLYTTLKKLQNAGLIERTANSQDNKKTYRLTDKGLEMLKNEVNRKKEMVRHAEEKLMEMGKSDE